MNTFPVRRPTESRAMYKARVHAYSTARAQRDGMVRAAKAKTETVYMYGLPITITTR